MGGFGIDRYISPIASSSFGTHYFRKYVSNIGCQITFRIGKILKRHAFQQKCRFLKQIKPSPSITDCS